MLKKKKGFNIVTKSVKGKLKRNGFDFSETKKAFNDVVAFYFALVNTHPEGVNIPVIEDGGWRPARKADNWRQSTIPNSL